jgi:hypothetical protein
VNVERIGMWGMPYGGAVGENEEVISTIPNRIATEYGYIMYGETDILYS